MSLPKNELWNGKTFVTLLILLVLVSALVRWRLDPVPITTSNASAATFSAPHAMETLSTILGDERPHPVDSSAQGDVRQRIVSALEQMGYAVDVQDTTSCNDHWGVTCARVRNLVVVSPGTPAGRSILLMAHYDSVPAGPGASDDGSGVAILLDIARLLKTQSQGRNSVILLFTDGEEVGLLGAKAFAEHDPRAKDIALAINVESRGTSGQSVMFQTGDDSGWLVDTFASTAQRPLTNSLLSAVYDLMPNDTDFTVFKDQGIPGLNFAFGERFPLYHTSKDNLQALDLRTLQQQGDNAYSVLSALRDADVDAAADSTATNLVYTDILGLGVIRWPASWSLGVLLGLLALFAYAALALKRRHHYSAGSSVLGFVCFFLVVTLGGASAWLLSSGLAAIHAPAPAWHSSTFGNRLLLWAVVLLASVWLPRLLIRKSNPLGLLIGIGLAWLLTGIATALHLPGLAYLFVLPSLALVVFAAIATVVRGTWADQAHHALFIVPALVAFLVSFPAVYIIEVLITFSLPGAIGMGVFIGLAATMLLPLTVAKHTGRTHLYAGGAVALVGVIGATLSLGAPAYRSGQPQALNISYVQDAAGNGHVFTATKAALLPAPVKQAMGDDGTDRRVLPWNDRRFYSVAINYPRLPVPSLAILAHGKTDHGHDLLVELEAGSRTQTLTLLVPKSAGLISAEMDGNVMTYQGHASEMGEYQSFVCHGESCDGKQVRLTMAQEPADPLLLIKATAGLPAEADAIARERNRSQAVPIGRGDQTLIINTIPIQSDENMSH